MIIQKNKVIFTNYVKENNLIFNYIDIGARGDIESPWIELENNSLIVGFEPDQNEAKRLNDKFKKRRYFGIALWSKKTMKKVHINEWESTSSMYSPNTEFIKNFQPKHWEGRKPKSIVEVECNTLDNVLGKASIIPDFIKIDTQGAELEILKGAKSILKEYAPMVTCETWCAEVYKNVPMMHEVIEYMNTLGYQVFDMELAAAWKHGADNISAKQKAIGYEILFVKTRNIKNKNQDYFKKFLLLLELYGYRDYAFYLASQNKSDLNLLLIENSNNESKFFNKFFNILINQINKVINFKYKIYPTIKY